MEDIFFEQEKKKKILPQDVLSHYDEDSCVDKVFLVVAWGVKVTPINYFDIQKTQLILELKYRKLKKRLNDLFDFL